MQRWFMRPDGSMYLAGDGRPEYGSHVETDAPVPTQRETALAAIAALELQQSQRLTPRAMREFLLGAMSNAGMQAHPAFVALAALDALIRAERGRL